MKTISHAMPMALCPINFKDFDKLLELVDHDIDAALLFAKIKFHLLGSRIVKDGLVWIARSREALGTWFGFSVKKIDRLLKLLSDKGLIKKRVGLWYGQKRLYIAITLASDELIPDKVEINIDMLDELIKLTGSVQEALLFARVAFAFNNTKIVHQDKPWCAMTKEKLSNWLGTSLRTIHTLIERLLKKGLLIKQKFNWNNKTQSHFHIPQFIVDLIMKRNTDKKKAREEKKTRNKKKSIDTAPNNEQGQSCPTRSAKMALSINKDLKQKKTNNSHTVQVSTTRAKETLENDIIFNQLNDFLSPCQEKYLKSAFNRTITRYSLKISSPTELWAQILFTITNKSQLTGIVTFKHAVNRIMVILKEKNWRTPKGFYNHAPNGNNFKTLIKKREESNLKKEKQYYTKEMIARDELNERASNSALSVHNDPINNTELTQKAIVIAERIKALDKAQNKEKHAKLVTHLLDEMTKLIVKGVNPLHIKAHLRDTL